MDNAPQVFVRQELVPQRAAPIRTTGPVAWVRSRLFGSPTSIILPVVSALLLYYTVVPAIKFLLIDAVWTGADRDACLPDKIGRDVGACWPFVRANLRLFMYGFYTESELWRPNLVFVIAVVLLIPLLIPRVPGKTLN